MTEINHREVAKARLVLAHQRALATVRDTRTKIMRKQGVDIMRQAPMPLRMHGICLWLYRLDNGDVELRQWIAEGIDWDGWIDQYSTFAITVLAETMEAVTAEDVVRAWGETLVAALK